jgi:hypothetical protein
MQTGCHQTDNALYGFALETAMTGIAARVFTFSQAQPDCSKLAVSRGPQYQNCQPYLMSRSFGSDGIRRYCDAAVAFTIVFATVIAMVAAVIVASNALNFSVATIAFVLTCPIPLFACSAADANQLQAPIAARQSGTLSSNITIEPERSLARTNHFLAAVFYSRMSTGLAGWADIIENKDKTHDNLSFIAYRPFFRLDHVFHQAATNFGAHSYQFKALNFHSII